MNSIIMDEDKEPVPLSDEEELEANHRIYMAGAAVLRKFKMGVDLEVQTITRGMIATALAIGKAEREEGAKARAENKYFYPDTIDFLATLTWRMISDCLDDEHLKIPSCTIAGQVVLGFGQALVAMKAMELLDVDYTDICSGTPDQALVTFDLVNGTSEEA